MSPKLKRMIAAFALFAFVCLLGACYWTPRSQKSQPVSPQSRTASLAAQTGNSSGSR